MKISKPLYKKAWFWVVLFFVVGGIGAAMGGDEEPVAEEKPVKTEFGIGDVITHDNYTFVVNGVRELEPNQFAPVSEGKIIIAVDATFENLKDKDAHITALNNILKDSDGRSQDVYFFGDTDGGLGGTILSGDKLSGESAFQVAPEGDLFFYFSTDVVGGDKLKVRVR